MIPGKQYTPELIIQIAWRYKWLILIPTVAISVGVVAWTQRLEDVYRSDAMILVVPQRVPEAYVRSTVTTRIEDRLQGIQQQIMSRTRLERIIQDFDLYAAARKTGIMEDIVERMRRDVDIQPIRGDAFRVSYSSEDPRTAMQVTERLASLFIDESLRDREVLAEGTNQFLDAQLDDVRRRLVDAESRQLEYRRTYDGQLPEQLEANVQGIQNIEMQLQALVESMNRDRDRRLILERQIADMKALDPSLLPPPPQQGPQTAAQQLAAAEKALAALELKLAPAHPNVITARRNVAELQVQADREAAALPVSAEERLSPAETQRRARILDLTRQTEDLDKQMAAKAREETRLRQNLAIYQKRIEATPSREAEMVDLMRDYSTIDTQYRSLLSKKQESQLSANLERRQIGEQFRILDPARLPARPFSPNRPRYYGLGLLAGLAIGLGLAAAVEYLDRTMRSEEDVRAALNLPVLATVPMVFNFVDVRRRRMLVAASVSTGVLLASAAAAAWMFLR